MLKNIINLLKNPKIEKQLINLSNIKMRKSSSIPKHQNHTCYNSSDTKMLNNKNKTISTIIHTEQEHQQLTTKKNSLNKINSCIKISNSSCKTSKSNLGKI